MKISVLGVCSGLGQRHVGLERAPKFLRDNGLIENLSEFGQVTDWGDLQPEPHDTSGWKLIQSLREKAQEVMQDEHCLLTLGGDHSIAIATVQASLLKNPNTRVVWVDAHGDINTPETSASGNLHGMPVAALLGLFEIQMSGPRLRPENLLLVGVRDLDAPEKKFLQDLKIKVITAEKIESHSEKALDEVREWLSHDPKAPVHLSFDVDAMDPQFVPATGLRVPKGLSLTWAKELIHLIAENNLVSMDFVELNPLQAKSKQELDQTLNSTKQILSSAFAH